MQGNDERLMNEDILHHCSDGNLHRPDIHCLRVSFGIFERKR